MQSSIFVLTSGLSLANALVIRSECELHFTASGAISGPVGEISSGQVRAGNAVSSTAFELDGDQLWDSKGNGCWWTPPTKVLQCDNNQNPASGWGIGCDGAVSFNGQSKFWECDTGTDGIHNVYLEGGHGENCKQITLTADACHASCAPPPPPPPPSHCPTNLDGNYEFPHLIIPVDSSKPNTAPGTSYFGEISATVSSIFNFDIPENDAGKTCSLVFLFPKQEDLQTSSFTFSGTGGIDFKSLNEPATESTTYKNMPSVHTDFGVTTVSPGHSYVIATFDCMAGKAKAFELSAVGNTKFRYFQDYNPAPIGLYITTC